MFLVEESHQLATGAGHGLTGGELASPGDLFGSAGVVVLAENALSAFVGVVASLDFLAIVLYSPQPAAVLVTQIFNLDHCFVLLFFVVNVIVHESRVVVNG